MTKKKAVKTAATVATMFLLVQGVRAMGYPLMSAKMRWPLWIGWTGSMLRGVPSYVKTKAPQLTPVLSSFRFR